MTKVGGALAAVFAMTIAPALVSCHGTEPQFSVSGNISGTTVPVVLKLNGGSDISLNGDGGFKFDQKLLKNDTFNVQVVDTNDQCTVVGGAGTIDNTNIDSVSINCIAQALQTPQLTIIRSAILSGSQENPAVTTAASGAGGIVVLPSTTSPMSISGGITFQGLAPLGSQINIFLAPPLNPAGNGAVLVPLILASDGLTAVVPPNQTIPAATLGPLLRGELYFNVGTGLNPNGEIRGAIQLQGGVSASITPLDNAQVMPPTTSSARGTGTMLIDLATGKVLIAYITHTVTGATTASLNTSAGAGSVIVAFANQRSNIDGALTNLANPASTTILSAQNLTDYGTNLLFYNISSAANPNGEIRGNISALPQ